MQAAPHCKHSVSYYPLGMASQVSVDPPAGADFSLKSRVAGLMEEAALFAI
jgi:hypothetical protein